MNYTKFWMVYKQERGVPVHVHATFQSAEQEAKRLAILNGGRFYVLCATDCFEKSITPILRTELL